MRQKQRKEFIRQLQEILIPQEGLLSSSQLIKLKAILEKLSIDDIEAITSAAVKQNCLLATEQDNLQQERRRDLSELFDQQMETLKSRGCPAPILKIFNSMRCTVLDKAGQMEIPPSNIPFLPIICPQYLGLYGLMAMVRYGDSAGDVHFQPRYLYFIYDIEDGGNMLNIPPQDAKQLIKEQSRRCLTIDEGIALCIHSDVLSRHMVDCMGTLFRDKDTTTIYLIKNRPSLTWRDVRYPKERSGVASCRLRG